MSIDVFVISASSEDWCLLQARGVVKPKMPDFHVVPCTNVDRLVHQIGSIVLEYEQHIDQLDFHGHGSPGQQKLGEEILFDHTGIGMSIAAKLSVFLTDYARVRLVGCRSVMGENGAKLLRSLKKEFGRSVTVQGTVKSLDCRVDYDEGGFERAKEEQWLFSSTDLDAGAVDGPNEDERTEERRGWMNRVREVMESRI